MPTPCDFSDCTLDERYTSLTNSMPCTTRSWITSFTHSSRPVTPTSFPGVTNILTTRSPMFIAPTYFTPPTLSDVSPTSSSHTPSSITRPSKRAVTGTGTCTTVYQITGTTTTWSPTTTLYPRTTTRTESVDCGGCVMWWGEHGIVNPGGQPTKTVSDWDGTATRFVAACKTSWGFLQRFIVLFTTGFGPESGFGKDLRAFKRSWRWVLGSRPRNFPS